MNLYVSRFVTAWLSGVATAGVCAVLVTGIVAVALRRGVPLNVSLSVIAAMTGGAVLASGAALAALAAMLAAFFRRSEVAGSWVAGFVALGLVARGATGLVPTWVTLLAAVGSGALAAAVVVPLTRWAATRRGLAAAVSVAALLVGAALPTLLRPQHTDPAAATIQHPTSPVSTSAWPPELARPRNVLLIVIDTLRADHLSGYGYKRATSPHIDRLAARGVRFSQASAQYTSTSPSMATLLTGAYPSTHDMVSVRTLLPMPLTTLAESLAAGGFNTAAVVSNPNLARAFQFDQGFAFYDEAYLVGRKQHGDTITDRATTWLRAHGRAPFFMYVHYLDPHSPYDPPAPFRDRFFGDGHSAQHAALRLTLRKYGKGQISEDAVIENGATDADRYVARYDEEIATVDHEVGRLLDLLDRESLSNDTLVILTADHGESLVEHEDYFNHGDFTYQTGAHVPLVLSLPGRLPAGRVIDEAVELADLVPTVLQATGGAIPESVDGRSLWPLMIDSLGSWVTKPSRVEAGHAAGRPSCSWRDGDWKLIYNDEGLRAHDLSRWSFLLSPKRWKRLWLSSVGRQPWHARWELYDLASDPNETRNLAVSRRDVFDRLAPNLLAWRNGLNTDRQLETDPASLDPDTKKLLESLGYVH